MPLFSKTSIALATVALTAGVTEAQNPNISYGLEYSAFLNRNHFCCAPQPGAPCYTSGTYVPENSRCYVRMTTDRGPDYEVFRLQMDYSPAVVIHPTAGPTSLSCIYSPGSSIPGIQPGSEKKRLYWQVDNSGYVFAQLANGCPPLVNNAAQPGKYFYFPQGASVADFSPSVYMGNNQFRQLGLRSNDQSVVANGSVGPLRAQLAGGGPVMESKSYRLRYSSQNSRYTMQCDPYTSTACVMQGAAFGDTGKYSFVREGGPGLAGELQPNFRYCMFWTSNNNQIFKIKKTARSLEGTLVPDTRCANFNDAIVTVSTAQSTTVDRNALDLLFQGQGLAFSGTFVSLLQLGQTNSAKISAYDVYEQEAYRAGEGGGNGTTGVFIGVAAAGGAAVGAGLMAVAAVIRNKRSAATSADYDSSEDAMVSGNMEGDNPQFNLDEVVEKMEDQL